MRRRTLLAVVFLTVLVSGCAGQAPEIVTSDDKVTIEGNSTEELEVQIKNNYKDTAASFKLNITSPEIVDVLESVNKEEKEIFDMGEAGSGSKTVKKVLLLRGNPEELGSLNSGTDQLKLKVSANAVNISEPTENSKNVTVVVKK